MELIKQAVKGIEDKKGLDIIIFDIRELLSYTDYIILCSGTSDKHVQAVADNISQEVTKAGGQNYGTEGAKEGAWVLLDFGDIIVHVFKEEVREYYKLEELWKNGKVIDPTTI